ncbi:MAG: hypothetical protein Q8S13_12335, partial [Dehalococcoidia bacterium]|nr:hypothetical protein [Dehalococcoidia bacterium]
MPMLSANFSGLLDEAVGALAFTAYEAAPAISPLLYTIRLAPPRQRERVQQLGALSSFHRSGGGTTLTGLEEDAIY